MKRIFLPIVLAGIFIFFSTVTFAYAADTSTVYGPYLYGSSQDTISIPDNVMVYIGELQTDSNYSGNYLDYGGFFVGGYAGNLTVNDVVILYEQNSLTTGTAGHDYTQYYYKSVTEETSRFREASTDPSWSSYSTYYHSNAELDQDGRWMDITDLVNMGQDNDFSFYHYTDSQQGYILRIVSGDEQEEEQLVYINSDFNTDPEVDNQSRAITGTGFSFDNFAENTGEKIIKDFFHLYNYNSLWYSDWQGNFFWKWSTDKLIDAMKTRTGNGTCFGHNFKAWELYRGYDDYLNYKTTAESAYDLTQSSIEREIKGTFFYQYAQEFDSHYNENLQAGEYLVDSVYEAIKDHLNQNGKADLIIGLTDGNGGGHAVTPYRIEEAEDGTEARVYVYDSNEPGDEENYITFELDANPTTWIYLPGMYTGSTEGSIFYYDLAELYNGSTPTFPTKDSSDWGLFAMKDADFSKVLIWKPGGYKLGYDSEGNFYNSMPDSYPIWGLGAESIPTGYSLSNADTYYINTFEDDVGFVAMNDQAVYTVSGQTSSDDDLVAINSSSLGYLSNDSGAKIKMTLSKIESNKAYSYELSEVSPDKYESLYISINEDSDLSVANYGTNSNTFDVKIKKETLTGGATVEALNLSIDPSSTDIIDVKDWKDLASSMVEFNNETVDTVIIQEISLPRVRKVTPKQVKKKRIKKKNRSNYKFTIIGNNFKKKSKVKFGKVKAKKVVFKSNKKLATRFNLKKLKKKRYTVTVTNPKKKKGRKQRAIRIY